MKRTKEQAGGIEYKRIGREDNARYTTKSIMSNEQYSNRLFTLSIFLLLSIVVFLTEPITGFGFIVINSIFIISFILAWREQLIMSIINEKEVEIHYYKGRGPGGQHRNKTANACRATHTPTGITVNIDARKRTESHRKALLELGCRVKGYYEKLNADKRKKRRDAAIKDNKTIRTYDVKRGVVKDHQTGKTAPIKEVLGKGRLDLLK